MQDTFSILSPAGYVMDVGAVAPANGTGTYGGVFVSKLLSGADVQVRGVGEHALNGRLSGRHGTMVINCTTGAVGSARGVAFIALTPTLILGVALDSSNRPYALLVDAFGTTIGQSEAIAAISAGTPLTIQLAWDAVNVVRDGVHAGFQYNEQVAAWTTAPGVWTPFVPTSLYVGTAFSGHALADFNGVINKVQVGDTVVFSPVVGAAVAEDLNGSAQFAGTSTFTASADVTHP